MNTNVYEGLSSEIGKGAHAYIRNLAAAETAVLNGQFNVAKVLRASAHTQRILATQLARLSAAKTDAVEVLQAIHDELEDLSAYEALETASNSSVVPPLKAQAVESVNERLRDIIQRSLASLSVNRDVSESDVSQFLWGCHTCGLIAEGERPQTCPVCGAPSVEFEWFGPFYAFTAERLGQLTPSNILTTLVSLPDAVTEVLLGAKEEVLSHRPSEPEWCIKEIVGHMLETHLLFVERVRAILEGKGLPEIPRSAPPWKLHEGKGYEALSPQELLTRLKRATAASVELVRGLEPDQWNRQGILLGTPTSVLDLGTWLANHDRGHLAQIRNLTKG